eukprot:scaffold17333_cov152-Isochrysis_galbana.AAC.1
MAATQAALAEEKSALRLLCSPGWPPLEASRSRPKPVRPSGKAGQCSWGEHPRTGRRARDNCWQRPGCGRGLRALFVEQASGHRCSASSPGRRGCGVRTLFAVRSWDCDELELRGGQGGQVRRELLAKDQVHVHQAEDDRLAHVGVR